MTFMSRGATRALLAGCAIALAIGGANAQSEDELYKAAQEEGSVVWYTTFPLDEATPLGEAFTEKYPGVNVEIVRGSGTKTAERFETEYRAEQPGADVITGAILDPTVAWKDAGWLMEYDAPEGEAIPADYKDPGSWYLEGVTISCILYAPDRVEASEIPDQPSGLMEEKWKGRIGSIPAWATGTALEFSYFVDAVLGDKDYPAKLRELDPLMESSQASLVQKVIRGEIDVALPIADYNLYRFKKDGANVECAYPKSDKGVPANVRPVAIPKNAPHPNAAKLFLNWRLSQDGQAAMQDGFGMRSVREDMSPPEGLAPREEIGVLILDPAEVAAAKDDLIARWQESFGQ